jgi:RNA polymerase sigma factor for flagellar operon FliA
MNLKSMAPAISIVPGLTKDLGVHLPAITYRAATQSHSAGAASHKIHTLKQYAWLDGSPESNHRNALVLEHLPLVKIIAASIRASLPVHVDRDDLIQAGTLGLIDAANKFDATKQIAFPTYANYRIKGAILDSLRDLDEVSRDMRRLHKQVESATAGLTQLLQRAPDDDEIAEKLGMKLESLRVSMAHIRSATRILISSGIDEDLPPLEFSSGPETRPDAICAQKKLQNTVRVALKRLPRRDQTILLSYYGDEMKMKKIGCMLGINESRVSQLHQRAIRTMKLHLRASGITSCQPL